MQYAVTFRHMQPTESLKAYARDRMERVRKYLPDPISCHVVMSTERHNHRIDVNFQLHNGLTIAGHEITENMYSSIDLCIAKIERQVRKYKGRLEERRRSGSLDTVPWSHSIYEEAFEPEPIDAPVPPVTESGSPPPQFNVVKTEKFRAEPMSVSDAIVQLNLANETFLVFRTDTDGRVAVVYKRDDAPGTYGLIETPLPT